MKLIVCLDDRNGMSFLGRRQSQDALLRKDLLAYVAGSALSMNAYSAAQFEAGSPICITEQPTAIGLWKICRWSPFFPWRSWLFIGGTAITPPIKSSPWPLPLRACSWRIPRTFRVAAMKRSHGRYIKNEKANQKANR